MPIEPNLLPEDSGTYKREQLQIEAFKQAAAPPIPSPEELIQQGPFFNRWPPVHHEREHTPWAHSGWLAWNEHAVETDIAYFLWRLAQMMAFTIEDLKIIETGVGQGFVSVQMPQGPNIHYTGYESDPEWRTILQTLPRWDCCSVISDFPTPSFQEMSEADLIILDSSDPWRICELMLWRAAAKPGSIMFIHDVGNGHPHWDGHYTLGETIRSLKMPGRWLENPRGAFLAEGSSTEIPDWVEEIWNMAYREVLTRDLSVPVPLDSGPRSY